MIYYIVFIKNQHFKDCQKREIMMRSCLHLVLILFLLLIISSSNSSTAASQSIVNTLPGYAGTLPFKLETGYISVGENDDLQLFYYFIESEGDPNKDPLMLWLTGGPGCSGFSGLVYEIGPLTFDYEAFDGSLPSFNINPYSWTKVASIIFIDSPVGTGFSYAIASQVYTSNDTESAKLNYDFLRKWLLNHPSFLKNRLYVAGDSYGGKIAPMVALEIAEGNEAGFQPQMSLQVWRFNNLEKLNQGYLVGNPGTDRKMDKNEKVPYAHRMALISDEYYELARNNCHGEYVNPDPNNIQCLYALRLFKECTNLIFENHILEPKCKTIAPQSGRSLTLLEDDQVDLLLLPKQEEPWCRNYNYATSIVWANDETVQEALHIRKGTITNWKRCNWNLRYEKNVESVIKYHQLLSERGYQALVYSGDHDMTVPYMSTLKWIRALNLTVDDEWRPWTVDSQVAGYTMKYKNDQAYLTFATVKGAGHTAPEYKPKQCFAMINRWLSLYPL